MRIPDLPLLLLILLVLAVPGPAQAQEFVRQVDLASSDYNDTTVTGNSGSITSAWGISSSGSRFELWDYNGSGFIELAESITLSYDLSVAISTTSVDVVNPNRTRADKPYTLTVNVSGLLASGQGEAGDQAVSVGMETSLNLGSGGPFTAAGTPNNIGNGMVTQPVLPTIDHGTENWFINRLAVSYASAYRYLNTTPPMEIFPLATIAFSGLPSTYSGDLAGFPAVAAGLTNLYPSDRTVILLVPPAGAPLTLYDSTFSSTDSVTTTVPLTLKNSLSQSGTYQLQVWQKTPVASPAGAAPPIVDTVSPGSTWGWEMVVAPFSFTVNLNIHVNADISTD